VNVVVVDDEEIARLHGQFMADPSPTDVLTFDLRDDLADGVIEGEIIVSAETARRQAQQFRVNPAEELLRYAIHGTLHLAGYDDHTAADRRRMRREENRVLLELAAGKTVAPKRKRSGRAASMKP
jgi:probable rRNA maturation factor